MTRKPRHLSAEEKELWDRVRAQTVPLKRDSRALPPLPEVLKHVDHGDDRPAPSSLQPFRIGERHLNGVPKDDLAPSIGEQIKAQPLRMDRKDFGRLKRGKLTPEARIDLHGMTMDRAHPALTRFILQSHSRGLRLVLVITGKGKDRDDDGPMPMRRGILRHQVPHWLAGRELAHAVLQVVEAHQRHGGGGAYYVYLRRKR